MNDQRRRKIEDALAEASLELLMDDYTEQSGEILWQEFQRDADCVMPENLDKACQDLIHTSFSKSVQESRSKSISARLKQLAPQACKAAMIAFAMVGAMATLTLSVEAIRVPVFNFFMKHTNEYTAIFSEIPQESIIGHEDIKSVIDSFLPDDYQMVIFDDFGGGILNLRYEDMDGDVVSLRTNIHDGQFRADTENAYHGALLINQSQALYIEKNGKRIIIGQAKTGLKIDFYAESLPDELFWEIACALAD